MKNVRERIQAGAKYSPSLKELDGRVEQALFLRKSWFEDWVRRASLEVSIGVFARVKLFVSDGARSKALGVARAILRSKEATRAFLNEQIVSAVLKNNVIYFDKVEKLPLTQKQREACASDEDATLVIAGAGTGKTSTILAKIGLLLRLKQCSEYEILAISFTSKSANELAERVKETLKVDVRVSTFHKLGLETLAKLGGGKPTLAPFAADPEEMNRPGIAGDSNS